jgi:hypothetical protein
MMRLHACDLATSPPHPIARGVVLLLQAKTIWDTTEMIIYAVGPGAAPFARNANGFYPI